MTESGGFSGFLAHFFRTTRRGADDIVAALFSGYFDESGDFETPPKVFCISGYYLTSDEALVMDHKWAAVLQEHAIPYFHMVECAHGCGVFAGKSKDERSEIVKKCIALIKEHTISGFSVLLRADLYEPDEKTPDPYSYSVEMCVQVVRAFLEIIRAPTDIDYIFEAGHKNKGRAYAHVGDKLGETAQSLSFVAKGKAPILQAADLLAWQSAKYAKDQLSGERPPRKDFLALMEHPHTLAYVSVEKGQPKMVFEQFPLSVRTAQTTPLTIDYDSKVSFMYEDGDPLPVVPVKECLGWRMGAGRMAFVKFRDLGKKEFALAFDPLGLHETIVTLLSATKLFAPNGPQLKAKNLTMEFEDDDAILRVHIPGETEVIFRLPKDAIEPLIAQLKATSGGP